MFFPAFDVCYPIHIFSYFYSDCKFQLLYTITKKNLLERYKEDFAYYSITLCVLLIESFVNQVMNKNYNIIGIIFTFKLFKKKKYYTMCSLKYESNNI